MDSAISMAWGSVLDTFGERVAVKAKDGRRYNLDCVFRESGYVSSPGFSDVSSQGRQPQVKYMPAKHALTYGDVLTRAGKTYSVKSSESDGYGGYVCTLRKVTDSGEEGFHD